MTAESYPSELFFFFHLFSAKIRAHVRWSGTEDMATVFEDRMSRCTGHNQAGGYTRPIGSARGADATDATHRIRGRSSALRLSLALSRAREYNINEWKDRRGYRKKMKVGRKMNTRL